MAGHGTRRGGLVYHWKHGWIPLDHFAALSKAKHSKSGAIKVMQKHGIDVPKGYHSDHKATAKPGGPQSSAEAFRMKRPELAEHAANGNVHAREELARRQARHSASGKVGGKRTGTPFRPPTKPAEPKTETPKAAPPNPVAPKVIEKPKAPTPAPAPKPTPKPPVAPEKPKAPLVHGSPEHKAAVEAENRRIEQGLPTGHTIRSTVMSRSTLHRHEVPDAGKLGGARRLGTVTEVHAQPGVFTASHVTEKKRVAGSGLRTTQTSHDLGSFTSRQSAHEAIAKAEAAHQVASEERATKQAAANAKKTAALTGLPGPGGKAWEPHTVTSDGTRFGDSAAAQVKQAYKSGNHTVIIETPMTKEQTKGLLSDITSVVDKAGAHQHAVTFHVPSGDRHFRASRRGTTGAYVIQGGKTIFINPRIANNAIADKFEAGGHSGHFMEAAKTVPARQYTLTHELGHVMDNIHQHTHAEGGTTPSGFQLPRTPREDVTKMARDQSGNLSKYGRTNNAEAYAEAFAQWTHGGPGSSVAADAFARRFGWKTPKGF